MKIIPLLHTSVRTLIFLLVIAVTQLAHATPLEDVLRREQGTMWANAHPDLVGGELRGCIIDYGVLSTDPIYKQGSLINLGGSFGVMMINNNIVATLKVILRDIDPNTGELNPIAPKSAYFVVGNGTTKSLQLAGYASDTPGGYFAVFEIMPTYQHIMNGLENRQITIAFARRAGGTDVQFVVDTSVEETLDNGSKRHSDVAHREFLSCSGTLLKNLEEKLAKPK